jgi:glycosyltransferase involved in cell wall biosynthesis
MHILQLHSRYLSGSASGENRVAEEEAELLRSAGHRVWRFVPEPSVRGPIDRARAGVSAIWSTRATATVRRIVEREGIDVVHAHNVFPTLSPAALRAAHEAGAATVVTLHNFRLFCLPANLLRDERICEACVGHLPWRGVWHRCYRGSASGSAALAASLSLHRGIGTFDHVTRYLAVSDFVRRRHIDAGFDPTRIGVKPNFVWPVPRRQGPGEHFLYLGRLSPEKGVDTLLSAWRLGDPPGKLVIAGDGPAGGALRADAPAGVEFLGQVPADQVPGILGSARALLLPSRWFEAAPRSITEAYAAGVPVVASDIGALPEAIDPGVTGDLVPVDDPRAWARAAGRLSDDAESVRLGEGAWRRWNERFTPEHGLAALEAAYAEAVAARRAAA